MNFTLMNQIKLVEENTDYVLGMYDLYHNDQEIIEALQRKGLSESIIQKILSKINIPSYIKRVKQASRNIFIGLSLFIIFFLLPYLIIKLNGSSFSSFAVEIENDESMPEYLKVIFRLYLQLYIFFVLGSLAQVLNGIIKLIKYKKLLKQVVVKD